MKKILATALLAASMTTTAGTLTFNWTEPTTRIDGSTIDTPLSYEIRYGDGTTDSIITAVGTTHSVEVADVPVVYYAQIRAVESYEDGATLRSEWSPVITSTLTEKDKSAPSVPSFTMTFSCDGCNVQVVEN